MSGATLVLCIQDCGTASGLRYQVSAGIALHYELPAPCSERSTARLTRWFLLLCLLIVAAAGAVQRGDALALLLSPEGEFVRGIGATTGREMLLSTPTAQQPNLDCKVAAPDPSRSAASAAAC